MTTFSPDKISSNGDVSLLLDEALLQHDYPYPDNVDMIKLKEYDRSSRQVFLWVSDLFTNEEWQFLEEFLIARLHERTRVAVCRSNYHFGVKK